METLKDIVEKLENTPMRIDMYTFILGIGTVADPKVRRPFVTQYTRTCIEQIYKDESDEFKAQATDEAVEYFMRTIRNVWTK